MKILLIDDDTLDRMNIIRTLSKADASILVTEASEANEGISFAEVTSFDLILLDYQLPSSNGLEVLKQISDTKNNNTAIIMLSHSDDDALALKCIKNGAQDFIKKNEISVSRLMRAIYHAQVRSRIEEQLRESHEKLRKIAQIDALTGLANRYAFDKSVKNTILLAKRQNHSLALIMMDLDKFKNVNDTLGHVAGDTLLQEVANRLTKVVREEEIFCRLGGDEFAILVHCYQGVKEVKGLINRILSSLKEPFTLENTPFVISASIGVATFPECADNAKDLLKCADIAMYRSKELGRNQAQFYSKSMHNEVSNRVQFELELREALKNDQFILYYQPQVSCQDETLVALEALIQWQHPTRGLIGSSEFITVAEEIGLVNDISLWIIEAICVQVKQWNLQLNENVNQIPFPITINLSATQLDQDDFVKTLKNLIEENGISPKNLELTLASNAIKYSSDTINSIEELAQIGIPLGIDDFGGEYSSVYQLKKSPFSILKIDKSFINSVNNESQDNFIKAIGLFAKTLNFTTVVNGVENQFQATYCKSQSVDRMQGSHIAHPMQADEFKATWLDFK